MSLTISEIADKVACGGDISANTGKLGCLSLFGTPDNLLLLKRGFKIPANQVFNLAYLKPLIMNGSIIPLMGASAFEDLSAEDTYSTNSSGIKRLNLKGLPEYKFMYEEGHEFYRQIDKLGGYKNFDVIIGDNEGNWMLATNSDGTYSGFAAGHTTPELTKRKVEGGDAESKSVLIQFLERTQFDRNYAILHQEELTFVSMDVPLVNGVNLEFTSVLTAGTTINVTAKLAQDRSTAVVGITAFTVYNNNVAESATVVAGAVDGNYVLTVGSMVSADVIKVQFQTSASDVVDNSGVLLRSNVLTDTIA